jgi:hypothetical protein
MSIQLSAAKRERFIKKLIDDTESERLSWTPTPAAEPASKLSEHYINYIYETKVADKIVRLGEVSFPYFFDEDRYTFDERPVLEFCDIAGNVQWRFPPSHQILELLDTVQKNAFNVEDTIDRFLEG